MSQDYSFFLESLITNSVYYLIFLFTSGVSIFVIINFKGTGRTFVIAGLALEIMGLLGGLYLQFGNLYSSSQQPLTLSLGINIISSLGSFLLLFGFYRLLRQYLPAVDTTTAQR